MSTRMENWRRDVRKSPADLEQEADLARDARALAQRNPALLVAGGLALGFALSRLLKASAHNGAARNNARTHYKARSH